MTVETDRWTLTIDFDTLSDQERANPALAFPNDECSRLIAHVSEQWGILPEELLDMLEWTPTRAVFRFGVLDYARTIMDWLTTHTVPKSATLIRNNER